MHFSNGYLFRGLLKHVPLTVEQRVLRKVTEKFSSNPFSFMNMSRLLVLFKH